MISFKKNNTLLKWLIGKRNNIRLIYVIKYLFQINPNKKIDKKIPSWLIILFSCAYIRNSQIKSKDQLVKYIYFHSSKYNSIYKINFKFKNL